VYHGGWKDSRVVYLLASAIAYIRVSRCLATSIEPRGHVLTYMVEVKQTQPLLLLILKIRWLRSMVFSLREIDYSSGRSNTWSVEAMKTIAKYEKDCEPQRYCILYHTSNAHCALSPHDGNAYSLISIDTLALTPEFSSESMLCCIACVEKTHSQFPVASAGHS